MSKSIGFKRYEEWLKADCEKASDCDNCPFADDCSELIELNNKIQNRFFKNGFYHCKG